MTDVAGNMLRGACSLSSSSVRLVRASLRSSRSSSPSTQTGSASPSPVRPLPPSPLSLARLSPSPHPFKRPVHKAHLSFFAPSSADTDTTRSPREGEVNGTAYHFVSRPDFEALVGQSAFIEHAEFSGNRYGTSAKAVKDFEGSGKRCILDIDMQVRAFALLPSSLLFRFQRRRVYTEDLLISTSGRSDSRAGCQADQGEPPSAQPRLPLHLPSFICLAQGAIDWAWNRGMLFFRRTPRHAAVPDRKKRADTPSISILAHLRPDYALPFHPLIPSLHVLFHYSLPCLFPYLYTSTPLFPPGTSPALSPIGQTESSLTSRLAAAHGELSYAATPNAADVVLVNDDLERAYALFKKVALGEEIQEGEGDKLPSDL
jgi:guanylate kinase